MLPSKQMEWYSESRYTEDDPRGKEERKMAYRKEKKNKVILDLNAKRKILAFLIFPQYRMSYDILNVGAGF